MAVITVSRQNGSNGGTVARLIAAKLGYRVLGRELVDAVAERIGVPPSAALPFDERGLGWTAGIVHSLLMGFQGQAVNQETCTYIACQLIHEAAEQGDLVILGRGSQAVLAGVPGVFHVYVVAPLEDRVREICQRERLEANEARRRIRDTDAARARYVRAIGKRDWADPDLYDLIINTHRLTPEAAADLVILAAEAAGVLQRPLPPRQQPAAPRMTYA